MERWSFDTLTFEHPTASRPAQVEGLLTLPAATPAPAMVLLTSSAGVQRHREHYYAASLAQAGVASLIVDSFTGRGVRRTVANQSLVSAAQMEGDAFAALARLRADPRIDPARVGVMGVSKGGVATVNAAIAVRQTWRRGFDERFDAHVAICPGAAAQHRTAATLGRPMFLMLGRHDDYTPAELAIGYAQRMRAAAPADIRIKVYGAHHGWESLGPVVAIRDAENWSACVHFIEDDGSHFVPALGRALPEPEFQTWARAHCVRRGAHAGGGTPELRERATADLLGFLRDIGFAR